MKRGGVLNMKLSAAIAAMGHDDIMLVCDAGLPLVYDGRVIDLALAPDVPDLFTVLRTIRQEMWVEKFAFIAETADFNPVVVNTVKEIFPDAAMATMPNEWFHQIAVNGAKYVVRTGAWRPWGNVALWSGIPVAEWFDVTGADIPADWRERYEKNRLYGKIGLKG
jgi:D-ribose pyranose/furanose isomerase RbsD